MTVFTCIIYYLLKSKCLHADLSHPLDAFLDAVQLPEVVLCGIQRRNEISHHTMSLTDWIRMQSIHTPIYSNISKRKRRIGEGGGGKDGMGSGEKKETDGCDVQKSALLLPAKNLVPHDSIDSAVVFRHSRPGAP